jgi:hypothetical protein
MTKILPFILLIGLVACRSESDSTSEHSQVITGEHGIEYKEQTAKYVSMLEEQRGITLNPNFDEMQRALLCSCLYQNSNISISEEGSLSMYIEMSNISLTEFDSLALELQKHVELNQFKSFNGSSLGIAECIEAVLLLENKRTLNRKELSAPIKSSSSNK